MDILLISLLRTTVLLSVVAIAVWLLLKAARVSSPKIQRAACCLVLLQGWVFMQVPVEIPYYDPPEPEALPMVIGTFMPPFEHAVSPEAYAQMPLAAAAPSEPVSYTPWLIGVWFCGMVFYVLCLAGRYLLFLRRLPTGRPCKNEWSEQWARLLEERGVRRPIPLRVTTLCGPALCRLPGGYELLIPLRFWKGLNPTGRLAILEHELAHFQRRDGLKSLAVRLLALPQWFNPLAWAAVRRFNECAEWACDRRAVGDGSQRASEYANALLRLGRFVGGHPSYSPAARGRGLSVRVRRLVSNYSMEDSVMKRISVIGIVTILAVFCLIHVELVAKEPVEKRPPMSKPVAEAVIKSAKPKQPSEAKAANLVYTPPSEANMVKLPYKIEPPDVVQIEVSGKDGSSVITGQYLVGPNGTVNLRKYGSVNLAGKTVPYAKKYLMEHLARKVGSSIKSARVHVEIAAYNSKTTCYIHEGDNGGNKILRLPHMGNETVRDVMKELPEIISAKSVRISRPISSGHGSVDLDLFVNIQAIRNGSAEHNLQIFPGDRIFVMKSKPLIKPSQRAPKAGRYSRVKSKSPSSVQENHVTFPKMLNKAAKPYSLKVKTKHASPAVGKGVVAGGDSSPSYVVSYSVKKVLSKIRQERGLSGPGAHAFLEGLLKRRVDNPARLEVNQLTWRKNGEEMVINVSRAGHKQVAEMLKAFRKFGTAEIEIRVLFVTLPAEELQQALPDWTASPLDVAELPWPTRTVEPAAFDRPLGNHEGTRVARAQLLIEKDLPVRFRIVDEELGAKLLDRWQAHKRTNILQAPKVRAFNGQTVCVSDTSQKPFVIGLKEVEPGVHKPQIRIVSEGTTLQLRPVADQSGAVHLDFAITYSKIRSVDVASFARTAGRPPTSTIQVPEVATARTEGGAMLKQGQWLLLGGLDCKDQAAKSEVIAVSWKACGKFIQP